MNVHPRTKPVLMTAAVLTLSLGTAQIARAGLVGPVTAVCSCEIPTAVPAAQLDGRKSMLRSSQQGGPDGAANPGLLTLGGELTGNWDDVDGNVVFSYDFSANYPTVGTIQVLVRGLNAVREAGTSRYRIAWDRAAYWLDFDGTGPGIPHLLGAIQRNGSYVPAASGDPYPELAANPAVQSGCTPQNPCSVNVSPFVLLREPGVDYSAYPELAASADLLFVANAQGQAIAGVVDVYDENEEYVRTKALTEGDGLQLSTVGFKMSEPQFLYIVGYTDFEALGASLQIQLENHIPGVDFPDPRLPPDLNVGQRRMKLLLDGYAASGGTPSFGLAGPFELGFDWAGAQDFLHRNGFDAPAASPTQAPLVAPRE